MIDRVRRASDANDPSAWQNARNALDLELETARKDLDSARTHATEADPHAQQELARVEDALARYTATTAELSSAPRGWKPVSREEQILAVLSAPIDGAAKTGYAKKEAQLKAELAQLSPAESHQLAIRLNKGGKDDPIAAAFGRLTPDRRGRILEFLGHASKRVALARTSGVSSSTTAVSPAPTSNEAASQPPTQATSQPVASAAPAATHPAPAAAPSAPIDAEIGHMIDAGEPDLDVLATIDGTRRRALVRRLEQYRPGNGDALGARFIRLERPLRERFLEALRAAAPKKAAHDDAKQVVVSGTFALKKIAGAPVGTLLATARIDASLLGAAQRAELHAETSVAAALLVAGDLIVLDVQIGAEHWTATVSVSAFAEYVAGPDAVAQAGSLKQLAQELPKRVVALGDRVRVGLWGDNFVVLDLARAVAGAANGNLDGLRPVEAHLAVKAGGVDVFANDQIKAATALPGEPLGGWLELPADASLRAVLGMHGDGGTVAGGVYYEDSVLRFALKPNAEAKTGVAVHADLAVILHQLESLGDHVKGWVGKALGRIKGKASDLLRMLGGKLHFELPDMPGTWFDFDLHVVLPHLFRGGGFDLGALLPTGFHLDLHGLSIGALPKRKFPWLHAPRLGGFDVPWQKLEKLVGALGSLPAPRLPELDFSLHLSGDLSLGLGIDLGAAWSELGDVALGFELDLKQLLAKIGDVGTALLRDLRGAGDFARTWVHLGADGVLRIYDRGKPDGPMVGFHLMKLLDGAQPSDLIPTEIRWNGGAASIEMGALGAGPADKATPAKPNGAPIAQRSVAAPDAVAASLGLAAGAKVDVELFYDGKRLTVWSEAPSALYASHQAVRSMIDTDRVAAAIAKHWPEGKPRTTDFKVALDPALSKDGPRFTIDGKVHGHATWTFEQLLGATDWTALVPSELAIEVAGAGDVQLGRFQAPGEPLGGRFEVVAPALRHTLLHETDGDTVWAGVHHGDDLIAVSLTKSETEEHEGALAEVHLSFLLRQLERLGQAGRALLEHLATLVHSNGHGDVFARAEEIARAIGKQILKLVNGVLQIDLGDYYVQWDLHAQLPHLGLDLSKLLPTGFRLPMPGLSKVGVALRKTAELIGHALGSFHVPSVHLKELIPNLHLDSLAVRFWQTGDLFSVWADLGDLFGDGIDLSFGFDIPLDSIVEAARKAGARLLETGKEVAQHVHLGADGVLRVFDPQKPSGDRVGFDLKQLFVTGASFESLIPSEVHLEAGNVAELSYGDTKITAEDKADENLGAKAKNLGKVLVPKPAGTPIAASQIDAPPWLSEHLGVAAGAKVHAGLYLPGKDAVAYASVDGSDRGVEIVLHAGALVDIVRKLPTLKLGEHDTVAIDARASASKGMLAVSFGSVDATHGHAAWKLDRLLSDPSLSSLDPDELELDTKQGNIRREQHLDLAGLVRRGSIPIAGWAWAAEALGDRSAQRAEVWTNDLRSGARIALVAEAEPGRAGKPAGIELDVHKDFVAQLEARMQQVAREASGAVQKTFHAAGAGALHGAGPIRPSMTAQGIKLEGGKAGSPDYMFATFGWQQLARLLGGELDFATLAPDELRVATKTATFELDALDTVPASLPADAHSVGGLHPVLKQPLEGVGLTDTDWIEIDTKASRITDPKTHRMAMVGHVYHSHDKGPRESVHVERATRLELDVDVEAVLAAMIPGKQWRKQAKDPTAEHRTTIGATVGIQDVAGQPGLDVDVQAKHLTRKGGVDEFELEAGWTLQQLLDALMSAGDGDGAGAVASALVPTVLRGSFADDTFKLTFSNTGHHSQYNCAADSVPGIGDLLGTLLEPRVLKQAVFNLNIPDKKQFLDGVRTVSENGGFLPVAGCSLEIPGEAGAQPHFYGLELALSIKLLLNLLYLIPAVGEIYGAAKGIYQMVTDPKETLETLAYSPEIVADLVEFGPDTVRNMTWKSFAAALIGSGDVSTRQGIMMMRIAKKLGKDWHKPGDKTNLTPLLPADYLEWLSHQNVDALRAMPDLDQAMQKAGVEIPDDYTIPSTPLTAEQIQGKIDELAAGFANYAEVKHKAEASHDPKDEAALQAAADALRKQTAKLLKAGTKESTVTETTPHDGGRDADAKDVETSDVSQLPDPTPDQEQEALALFSQDGDGQVLSHVHARYWIQKFAALSTEQLGELLATGTTVVVTDKGRIPVPMFPEERPFVRTLFLHRTGKKAPEGMSPTETGGASDTKLVADYRSRSAATTKAKAEAADAMGLGDGDHGGKRGSGDGDGNDGDGATSKSKTKGGQGDTADGSDSKSKGAAAKGKHDDKANEEVPETLTEFTRLSPAMAQSLVHFDLEQGRVTFLREQAKDIIGHTFHDNVNRQFEIVDMKIGAYHSNGSGKNRVFEYTLEIDVSGKATGGLTMQTFHTYMYVPAENKSHELGIEDPMGFANKINAAVNVVGNVARLTNKATFTHGPYTITVTKAEYESDDDSEKSKHDYAWVKLTLSFDRIDGDGTIIVKDIDLGAIVVHAHQSATIRGMVKKQSQ